MKKKEKIEIDPETFDLDKTDAFPYSGVKIIYYPFPLEQQWKIWPDGIYRLIGETFIKVV